jgi:hypothetical protein
MNGTIKPDQTDSTDRTDSTNRTSGSCGNHCKPVTSTHGGDRLIEGFDIYCVPAVQTIRLDFVIVRNNHVIILSCGA